MGFCREARTAIFARPMELTDIPVPGFERLARAVDPESGLQAIICVHDTTLGPSLGGLRMWDYATEEEALFDVKRLARGMTYKSAVARTGLGGGKSVIIGKPATTKSEALYLAMGRFIEAFDGSYITAEDVNTSTADLEIVRRATRHVTGLSRDAGGCGDPSPFTAYGVFLGLREAVAWRRGKADLNGVRVAVQGVGSVGSGLVRHLVTAGAKVLIADRRQDRVASLVDELGVEGVAESEILFADVDVLAPCALGAILDGDSIPQLRCEIVAGAANNVLLAPEHGKLLRDRDILYAPDYVINAGGIIHIAVSLERGGYDEAASNQRVERIPEALRELWSIARAESIPASDAADRLAENILAEARPGVR
ncbi:MAG: Glu/Leu/Phe/Val dehydrogenase dimerization domain-containing protein [Planctomycetota bacterium]